PGCVVTAASKASLEEGHREHWIIGSNEVPYDRDQGDRCVAHIHARTARTFKFVCTSIEHWNIREGGCYLAVSVPRPDAGNHEPAFFGPSARRAGGDMPFRSLYPDIAIPEVALGEFVLARAAARGDKPALIDGSSGRTIS